MEIILLEKVGKLGHIGDKVKVKNGFARNFLIPMKKALRITKSNLEFFETKKIELLKKSEDGKKVALSLAEKIKGKSFVIIRQAGDTGHLYGSVSTRDLAAILKSNGTEIDYTKITIDTPIKALGIYKVRVALHPEIIEMIKINVARSEEEAKATEEKSELEAKKVAEKKAKAKKEEAEEKVEMVEEKIEIETEIETEAKLESEEQAS